MGEFREISKTLATAFNKTESSTTCDSLEKQILIDETLELEQKSPESAETTQQTSSDIRIPCTISDVEIETLKYSQILDNVLYSSSESRLRSGHITVDSNINATNRNVNANIEGQYSSTTVTEQQLSMKF